VLARDFGANPHPAAHAVGPFRCLAQAQIREYCTRAATALAVQTSLITARQRVPGPSVLHSASASRASLNSLRARSCPHNARVCMGACVQICYTHASLLCMRDYCGQRALATDALRCISNKTPVHIQTKIHRCWVSCEEADSYDTAAAPDDERGDSVLDASVIREFALRTSQAKRHKGRQTAAVHQLQALVSVTRHRGFKRALPLSGDGLYSRMHKRRKGGATAVERGASSCGRDVQKRTSVEELRERVRNCANPKGNSLLLRIGCHKECPNNKMRLDKRLQCCALTSRTL
jgi:hypothetical protein